MTERNTILEYADEDGRVHGVHFTCEEAAREWAAEWNISAFVIYNRIVEVVA